mmetsp:Transcript_11201/g.24693  ORF Transcript_11201/g.24693 Transcript_11201/m.24693 type:complete len:210 (-) Transcript_11201:486-1115(-)
MASSSQQQPSPLPPPFGYGVAPQQYQAVQTPYGEATNVNTAKRNYSREKVVDEEEFTNMLNLSYGPRKNTSGNIKRGINRKNHSLSFEDGIIKCVACKNKKVTFGLVVQHIIGETHLSNLEAHHNEQGTSMPYVGEGDVDMMSMAELQSSGKRRKYATATNDNTVQSNLTVNGMLMVNEVDVLSYLKNLETRIEVLEAKLAEKEANDEN